ncbi:hypothetical protein GGI20_002203 [Coemansia sp. BCRC 34301]|nr:hypothetical protein GGI20_002203 [Coemansia sp. BCRC 34301]
MPAAKDTQQRSHYKVHVASDDEFKQALQIRVHVFVEIQRFPLDEEVDELDLSATHLVITDTRRQATAQVVGTLRIIKSPEAAKFGRVVILPEYQGQGLGKILMQCAERYVADCLEFSKYKVVKLGSQLDKRGFYESCGYEARGDVYDDTGAPHIWMYKPIQRGS